MSSSTEKWLPQQPLFTREMLDDIETELAKDGVFITLQRSSGEAIGNFNMCRGVRPGATGLAPGEERTGNVVAFYGERHLQDLKARGTPGIFFPVYNGSVIFRGPNRTVQETRETFARVLLEFRESEEGIAMANLIKTELKGRAVYKVIAFGLGRVGFHRPGVLQSFYEHAAIKVIAGAVEEVSSCPHVSVAVQDPLYTDVCRTVLEEFGLDVVPGFGAKGFAMIDDRTIVLTHHPNFSFREIVADIARPALICMKERELSDVARGFTQNSPDIRADVESVRSRRMLLEYRETSLPASIEQKAFWANTWYVRNNVADSEQRGSNLDTGVVCESPTA
ncbi:hypothetical protein GGR55DRAFT_310808 [Xylaria sp. FL0064]|nr:hypothetical protein GGR55DRAFT_310808 [Xylaria sp. FL0064]